MCLGDMLGSVCGPCVGCLKYIGSGLGLGLVFSTSLVGLDLAADWPIVLILLACIVALIWFIVTYCCGGLLDKDEDEFGYITRYFDPMCDPKITQVEFIDSSKRSYSQELAATCQQMDDTLMALFVAMIWHMLILVLIFLVLTAFFLPVGTFLGFLVGVLFGAGVMTLITWFALKYASRSLSRILINATHYKEQAFVFMFQCGFGAIMLAMACVYFFFVICYFLFKAGLVEGLADDKSAENIAKLGVCVCGYALGIIVAGFVYREADSILTRGLFNATDALVKTDKNLSFNNPYISHPTKLLYLMQSLIQNQVVNLLDASICFVVLTAAAFVIFGNSAEILGDDITYKSLLAPTIYLSVNLFCSVLVQLFKTWFDDGETVAFTMYNCRLQVIMVNIVSFLIFILMPMATILGEFNLAGTNAHESVQTSGITITKVAWACILGQLGNLALICYLEWLTSHGCRPVHNLSLASVERIPMQNVNYATYLGGFAGMGALFIVAILSFTVYSMCGWSGFMAAAAGFLVNLFIYIPILYVGVMSADGYKLCCMGMVHQIVTDRLYKMAWAARNYIIYVKISTGIGAFLLAMCFLGSSLFYFQKDPNLFVKGVGLYGVLVGIAFTYAYRGWAVAAIISVSKNYDLDIFKSGVAVEVAQDETAVYFVRTKLWITMKFIYFIFIFNTIFLFLNGFLFGYQATIGFLIGNILITLFLTLNSLITGTSLKNARYYNEANPQIAKRDSVYNNYVYADTLATVIDESNAVPLIIYMLYNVLLITACHDFFKRDGDVFQPAE